MLGHGIVSPILLGIKEDTGFGLIRLRRIKNCFCTSMDNVNY